MKTLIESILDDEDDVIVLDAQNVEISIKEVKNKIIEKRLGGNTCLLMPLENPNENDKYNLKIMGNPHSVYGMGFEIVEKHRFSGYADEKGFIIRFLLYGYTFNALPTGQKLSNPYMVQKMILTPIVNKYSTEVVPKEIQDLTVKYNDIQKLSKLKLKEYLKNRLAYLYMNGMNIVKNFNDDILKNEMDFGNYKPVIDKAAEKILR